MVPGDYLVFVLVDTTVVLKKQAHGNDDRYEGRRDNDDCDNLLVHGLECAGSYLFGCSDWR